MLDTNMISYVARNRSPAARIKLLDARRASVVSISIITQGEILYGFAKSPHAHRIARAVTMTLAGLDVLPWSFAAAEHYGRLRAANERLGFTLNTLDMLIAAHASSEGSVLVTNDRAIARLAGGPETVNWAEDLPLH